MQQVLKLVNNETFASLPPSQIIPIIADRGQYICSESTMYRVLRANNMQTHRGKARAPVTRVCPRLKATRANQVYSWDITFLPTNIKGQFFYLYLFIDIYSRYIVGWTINEYQDNKIAAREFINICKKNNINTKELTLHADNGGPMKGATMLATMQNLGVIKSFSRPATSNDNPFSEAMFKTVKYCPRYPRRPFAKLEDAITWMSAFVCWYNYKHRHSGIKFVTPYQRHHGLDVGILCKRKEVYTRAKNQNPGRWSGNIKNFEYISKVYINPLPEILPK